MYKHTFPFNFMKEVEIVFKIIHKEIAKPFFSLLRMIGFAYGKRFIFHEEINTSIKVSETKLSILLQLSKILLAYRVK